MPAPDCTSANVGAAVTSSYQLDIELFDYYWHLKQAYPNGQRMVSAPLKAGGCSWRIHYYPNGVSSSSKDYISIFVALDSKVSEPIKVWSRFTLLDHAGEPVPAGHSVCTDIMECSEVGATHGCDLFIRKKSLETSGNLRGNGCFAIVWDVFVYRATPQPDFSDADVTFLVGGQEFSAHSSVVAARSLVFEAELNSATRAAGECIRVDDMLPDVFDSLIHFVYTDSLPEMAGAEEPMMAEHLLVAADRFGMRDLKLICEEKLLLCTDINEDTIAKMLKLAVQHHCSLLRDACIQFLEEPPVLQAVMANGDEDLLELVAKTCPALLKELWVYDEDDCMQEELALYL